MSHRILKSVSAMALVLVAVLAIGAAPAGAALAQQESPLRTITVPGYGIAYGAPDIAYLSLGVESGDPDITVALADASARMDTLLAALTEAGIAREDIRTTSYNIYRETPYPTPMIDSSEAGAPEQPVGVYRVSTFVDVTVRDTSKVGEMLGTAVEAGANAVNNISFDIDNRAALELKARLGALDDARDRAQQIADALGVQLSNVLEVIEGSTVSGPVYDFGGERAIAAAQPPISEGTLGVSISLTVTFAIQ